ncbi:DNA polymerase III subunit chi [Ramlibacter sp.]|uniref:DNA polymerase III subunit chi n=1 Tax=Ramlibacter sp. TaxID=1917967 RepID=UPI003D111A5D
MTEVAFHFNAPDKIGYACRLLRKARSRGSRVVVTGADELLRRLDVTLWTFEPLEFIPHCHAATSTKDVVAASPIVLADGLAEAPHREVLVNLGQPVPEGFEGFERLIEVVTADEADRADARRRWKHYADRGYSIQRHDLAGREG